MKLTFFARDAANKPLGQLDAFTKVMFVPAYNAIKGWYAEIGPDDLDSDQVEMMQAATSLAVKNGADVIYTGTVNDFEYDSRTKLITVSGLDALALSGRRALPVPSGPPYTSAEYDVRSGAAETIIKEYVDYNAGPSAKADRRIAGLTIEADQARGESHTGQARFDNLTEFIVTIALARGLGVRVLDGVFQVYQPVDRSEKIRFSDEIDTLGSYKFHVGKPKANYLYGAGAGEGPSQAFYEKGDTGSIVEYGREEAYVNVDRTAVEANISAQLDAELQKQAGAAWFVFDVIETPDREFWTDFWLGDLVLVQARGLQYITRLSELTVTAYPDGSTELKPVFINNATFEISRRSHDRLRLMEQRLARLEQK
jgi:hypothetical protein